MTPQEQELVKKLAEQVNNIAHLVAGTEAGESQTLKEIRDLVYELNKRVEEQKSKEAEIRATIEKAREILNLNGNDKSESISGIGVPVDMKEYHKNLQRITEGYIEEMYHDLQKRRGKIMNINTNTTQPPY